MKDARKISIVFLMWVGGSRFVDIVEHTYTYYRLSLWRKLRSGCALQIFRFTPQDLNAGPPGGEGSSLTFQICSVLPASNFYQPHDIFKILGPPWVNFMNDAARKRGTTPEKRLATRTETQSSRKTDYICPRLPTASRFRRSL